MDNYSLTINALVGALSITNSSLEQRVLSLLPVLAEQRARHWTKGAHGYFTGSYSDGASGGGSSSKGIDKSGGSGIISRGDIFIHPDKINKFCLDPKGKHANDFFSVGYKPGDYEILYQDLMKNFDESKIVDKVNPGDGVERFSVFMDLGVDKKKRFRTVWQKDTPDSKPRFITAHRED